MATLRQFASWTAFILGALAILGGVGHWIAVSLKAWEEGRGYDIRLGDMLAIGFLPFMLGAAMVVGAWHARQDASAGFALTSVSAMTLAIVLVVLWRVIFTGPEGSPIGGALTVIAYLASAVTAWLARA